MSAKHILALFGVALLVGWFLPGKGTSEKPASFAVQSEGAPVQENAPALVEESTVADEDMAFGKPQGAVLKRQDDGHFYADVAVNGTDIHFLIDTGASNIALTADDAKALGLRWSEDDLENVGRGANGDVLGIPVTLDNVELGGIRARAAEAVIIPDGLDVSLLGQSFLGRAQSVKIHGDRMELD